MDEGIKVEKEERSKPAGAAAGALVLAGLLLDDIMGADVSMAPDNCEAELV